MRLFLFFGDVGGSPGASRVPGGGGTGDADGRTRTRTGTGTAKHEKRNMRGIFSTNPRYLVCQNLTVMTRPYTAHKIQCILYIFLAIILVLCYTYYKETCTLFFYKYHTVLQAIKGRKEWRLKP